MAIDVSALRAAGLSDAQIVAVFEKAEEIRKAKNRERQAAFQARKRANVSNTTNVTNENNVSDVIPVSEAEPRARVVNTNLPSGDNNIPPLSPKPEKPKPSDRGHRLPETWKPGTDLIAFARSLGFSDDLEQRERAGFFDYWRGIPGAKGRKLDWDGTYRNRLREVASRMKLRPQANILPFGSSTDPPSKPPQISDEEGRRIALEFERSRQAGR